MKKARHANKIGRKRRTLGWTLLLLGLLVAAVWVWSGWNEMVWYKLSPSGLTFIKCEGGRLAVSKSDPPHLRGVGRWRYSSEPRTSLGWDWTYHYSSGVDPGLQAVLTVHVLPAWPIPLLLWTPAALLLRSGIVARRRAVTGKCKACGYDLAGLASDAPCPECGKGALTT